MQKHYSSNDTFFVTRIVFAIALKSSDNSKIVLISEYQHLAYGINLIFTAVDSDTSVLRLFDTTVPILIINVLVTPPSVLFTYSI